MQFFAKHKKISTQPPKLMFSFGLNFQTIHHERSETIPPLPTSMLFLKILFSSSSFFTKLCTSSDQKQSLKFKYSTTLKLGEEGQQRSPKNCYLLLRLSFKSLNHFVESCRCAFHFVRNRRQTTVMIIPKLTIIRHNHENDENNNF